MSSNSRSGSLPKVGSMSGPKKCSETSTGFLCGWCYWTANMFFIPTLLFYLVGFVTYTGDASLARLSGKPALFRLCYYRAALAYGACKHSRAWRGQVGEQRRRYRHTCCRRCADDPGRCGALALRPAFPAGSFQFRKHRSNGLFRRSVSFALHWSGSNSARSWVMKSATRSPQRPSQRAVRRSAFRTPVLRRNAGRPACRPAEGLESAAGSSSGSRQDGRRSLALGWLLLPMAF